jgi:hypothetical protein
VLNTQLFARWLSVEIMSYDWLWSFTALIFVIIPIIVYLILRLFICPSVKRLDLVGKHVFITGGSKGIGLAMLLPSTAHAQASVVHLPPNVIDEAQTCRCARVMLVRSVSCARNSWQCPVVTDNRHATFPSI